MDNAHYLKDSRKFWDERKKARETRDEQLARLPFEKKLEELAQLQADAEDLGLSKREFGLGQIPDDATNEFCLEKTFTHEDFENALPQLLSPQQEETVKPV